MGINLTLLVVMGVLYAVGVHLVLDKSLTRVLLGIVLLTNATNLLIIQGAGLPGDIGIYHKDTPAQDYTDPLPQALILTAIVIGLAVTAFVLALIYRSWSLSHRDDIDDDDEDRRIARQDIREEEHQQADQPSEFDDEEFEEVAAEHRLRDDRRAAKGTGKGSA